VVIPEVRSEVVVVTPKVVIPAALRFLEISTSVVAIETGVGADTVTLPVVVFNDTFVPAVIVDTTPTANVVPLPRRL